MNYSNIDTRVKRCLESFLHRSEISNIEITPTLNLITEAGFTSLQGLEFALDLCDEFEFEFPVNFNPFVDDKMNRGQTFRGLVVAVAGHLANEGASIGKKR